MNDDELLQRYLDGELLPDESRAFSERLRARPELQRELTELQLVGGLVRRWAHDVGARSTHLLSPTLARIDEASARRSRHSSLGMAVATAMLLILPSSGVLGGPSLLLPQPHVLAPSGPPAAIERLEAGDRDAHVFIVGQASTPVVWLADDGAEDAGSAQDPG